MSSRTVLLVPGFAGCKLLARLRADKLVKLWPKKLRQDVAFESYLRMNSGCEIVGSTNREGIPGLKRSFKPYQVLKPTPSTHCMVFTNLVTVLECCGMRVGDSIFGYSYDWRQSLSSTAVLQGLVSRIKELYNKNTSKRWSVERSKICVITHFSGCILLRNALYVDPSIAECISCWVCANAPWKGMTFSMADNLVPFSISGVVTQGHIPSYFTDRDFIFGLSKEALTELYAMPAAVDLMNGRISDEDIEDEGSHSASMSMSMSASMPIGSPGMLAPATSIRTAKKMLNQDMIEKSSFSCVNPLAPPFWRYTPPPSFPVITIDGSSFVPTGWQPVKKLVLQNVPLHRMFSVSEAIGVVCEELHANPAVWRPLLDRLCGVDTGEGNQQSLNGLSSSVNINRRSQRLSFSSAQNITASITTRKVRNPMILIPGIGGTVLRMRDMNTGADRGVWLRAMASEKFLETFLWGRYNPTTRQFRSFYDNVQVYARFGADGLDSIDTLLADMQGLFPILSKWIVYFGKMTTFLTKKCGYTPGVDLFGMPYDWRQHLGLLAYQLHALILRAYHSNECTKVNIVAHSMGGLLVVQYMKLFPHVWHKYINKLVCIGTPFRGAGGCITTSPLWGYTLKFEFFNPTVFKQIEASMPASCYLVSPVGAEGPNVFAKVARKGSRAPKDEKRNKGIGFRIDTTKGSGRSSTAKTRKEMKGRSATGFQTPNLRNVDCSSSGEDFFVDNLPNGIGVSTAESTAAPEISTAQRTRVNSTTGKNSALQSPAATPSGAKTPALAAIQTTKPPSVPMPQLARLLMYRFRHLPVGELRILARVLTDKDWRIGMSKGLLKKIKLTASALRRYSSSVGYRLHFEMGCQGWGEPKFLGDMIGDSIGDGGMQTDTGDSPNNPNGFDGRDIAKPYQAHTSFPTSHPMTPPSLSVLTPPANGASVSFNTTQGMQGMGGTTSMTMQNPQHPLGTTGASTQNNQNNIGTVGGASQQQGNTCLGGKNTRALGGLVFPEPGHDLPVKTLQTIQVSLPPPVIVIKEFGDSSDTPASRKVPWTCYSLALPPKIHKIKYDVVPPDSSPSDPASYPPKDLYINGAEEPMRSVVIATIKCLVNTRAKDGAQPWLDEPGIPLALIQQSGADKILEKAKRKYRRRMDTWADTDVSSRKLHGATVVHEQVEKESVIDLYSSVYAPNTLAHELFPMDISKWNHFLEYNCRHILLPVNPLGVTLVDGTLMKLEEAMLSRKALAPNEDPSPIMLLPHSRQKIQCRADATDNQNFAELSTLFVEESLPLHYFSDVAPIHPSDSYDPTLPSTRDAEREEHGDRAKDGGGDKDKTIERNTPINGDADTDDMVRIGGEGEGGRDGCGEENGWKSIKEKRSQAAFSRAPSSPLARKPSSGKLCEITNADETLATTCAEQIAHENGYLVRGITGGRADNETDKVWEDPDGEGACEGKVDYVRLLPGTPEDMYIESCSDSDDSFSSISISNKDEGDLGMLSGNEQEQERDLASSRRIRGRKVVAKATTDKSRRNGGGKEADRNNRTNDRGESGAGRSGDAESSVSDYLSVTVVRGARHEHNGNAGDDGVEANHVDDERRHMEGNGAQKDTNTTKRTNNDKPKPSLRTSEETSDKITNSTTSSLQSGSHQINEADRAKTFQFFSISGVGFPTSYHAFYEDTVKAETDIPKAKPSFVNVPGDGTVPLISALSDPFPSYYVGKRIIIENSGHFGLIQDERTFQVMCEFLELKQT